VSLSNRQTYGNGAYTCTASSIYGTAETTYMAFDKASATFWTSGSSSYSTHTYTTSYYATTSSTTRSGEWIQIAMPAAIYVGSYYLFGRETDPGRFPAEWYLVGSNDAGSNWYLLDSGTNSVKWTTAQVYQISKSSPVWRVCVSMPALGAVRGVIAQGDKGICLHTIYYYFIPGSSAAFSVTNKNKD
jgi:hypothetical protein